MKLHYPYTHECSVVFSFASYAAIYLCFYLITIVRYNFYDYFMVGFVIYIILNYLNIKKCTSYNLITGYGWFYVNTRQMEN